ncbi:MAG: ribose-5-phosphate isomerase RpiA [Spirochaetales bacterium]|nr:ribose-5-phosphate isomerase RpiA [Spirochaetales bacterium]
MKDHEIKQHIGKTVVDELVRDGMKLGMGTGSTAVEALRYIKQKRDRGELMNLFIVPTSIQTELECRQYGMPLWSLNDSAIGGRLDLTIDGADEIDPEWNLIKGGGGALLLEKIVAFYSSSYAIIAENRKLVEYLGQTHPIPVEVVPSAVFPVIKTLESIGATCSLRLALQIAGPVITKQGNLLLDISMNTAFDPVEMEQKINQIPGIMENGIFTLPVTDLFIGHDDGRVEHREKRG